MGKGKLRPVPSCTDPAHQASSGAGPTYVRTLWRPKTKATLRLQGCTKPAQLVSMVTYSPFRAQKRIGEWSKGWPANCRTEGVENEGRVSRRESWAKQRATPWRAERPRPQEIQPQAQPWGSPAESREGRAGKRGLTLLVDGQHEGPVLRMQEQEHWGPQEILGQVAQQRRSPERGGGIRVAMASAPATPFSPRSCAHLSSTSWKRQLGVCRVVKILLSGGIRGAEAQEVWPLDFIQSGPASLPRFSRGAQAGWQSSPWLCPGPSSLQRWSGPFYPTLRTKAFSFPHS